MQVQWLCYLGLACYKTLNYIYRWLLAGEIVSYHPKLSTASMISAKLRHIIKRLEYFTSLDTLAKRFIIDLVFLTELIHVLFTDEFWDEKRMQLSDQEIVNICR